MKTFNRNEADEMRILKAYACGKVSKEDLNTIPPDVLAKDLKKIVFKVYIRRASDNALVNPDGTLYTPEQLAEYDKSEKADINFNVNFNR